MFNNECMCPEGPKGVICGNNGCRCDTCGGLSPIASPLVAYDPAKDQELIGKIALAIRVGQSSHLSFACGCMGPSEFAVGAGQTQWCRCAESQDRNAAQHVIYILKALKKI